MISEGTRIGPYRIVGKLGEGGMGAVYEAVHTAIERRVAIKILHAEHAANRQLAARLFNEARAVNIVGHPGLVQVSDFGQTDGFTYMVMECLSGESLAARLDRLQRLSEDQALRIVHQLASALSATHAHGIVHRDLKPGNVMLVADPADPAGERVKLLDFGIAKLSPASQLSTDARTSTGLLMGTPLYMSPEQCRGDVEIDGRTDVYALGIMMYEMLEGQPPFDAVSPLALLNMHVSRPLPPLTCGATQAAAALVEAMLRKDAAARPTMAQIAAVTAEPGRLELAAVEQLLAVPESPPDPSAAGLRTHLTLGMGTGQLVRRTGRLPMMIGGSLLMLLGLITTWRIWRAPEPAPQLAVTPAATTTTAAPAPERPRPSRILIETSPPGAAVVSAADLTVLGQTAWTYDHPAGSGTLELIVRRAGYRELTVLVPLDHDVQIHRDLELLPSPGRSPGSLRPQSRVQRPATATSTAQKKTESHVPISRKDIVD